MIERCESPKNPSYRSYGGRGIRVCSEWRKSFSAFFAHVGPKPARPSSLERKDVNGNYEPGNVRWATPKEQARNRRDNIVLAFQGRSACISEWAEIVGVKPYIIRNRLRYGWSVESALTIPNRGHIGKTKQPIVRAKVIA